MSFIISGAHNLVAKAMDERALRAELISGNIANVDTPFYKARDVDFETALTNEANALMGENDSQKLQLAQTNGMHLEPFKDLDPDKSTVYLRDGHMARNDGNTVDLDVEMSEMSKNNIMFNALSAAIKKDSTILKAIIESSRSL
jgi:flagellar basal-body rod protein FlgB